MDEGNHIKEVYAHFGLALYLAQVLEHGIVNALVYTDLIPRRTGNVTTQQQWAQEFDIFMDGHFEKTLGRLIKTLKNHVAVPKSLEEDLSKAQKLRNFLAHAFFRERSVEFMSFPGREKMIEELETAQTQLRLADKNLDKLIEPYRKKIGFTDELLQEAYKEHCRENGIDANH